jgi:DNA-nicking Smr family endonuclease
MSRRRSLSDEEHALWGGVARSVKPLQPAQRMERAQKNLPESLPGEPSRDEERKTARAKSVAVAQQEAPPPKATPPLAPLGRRLKQRVARGREAIDGRLDLHGHTQAQAHAALLRFLRRVQGDDARFVIVVTGKGRTRSDRGNAVEPGVLKRMVPQWLSLPEFRPYVVGFEDAHVGHGGEGALYVRVRRVR